MSLYPTPTRLRFLADVRDRHVYSQPHPAHAHLRESFYDAGAKCTAMAYDVSRAAWIAEGGPVQTAPERRWWTLTEAGEAVLAEAGRG